MPRVPVRAGPAWILVFTHRIMGLASLSEAGQHAAGRSRSLLAAGPRRGRFPLSAPLTLCRKVG